MSQGLAIRGKLAALAATLLLACIPVGPALAQITAKDVQIAVRTIGFVRNPPNGPVDLAILFDPAVPVSAAEAQTATATIGGGLRVGAATVRGVPLSISDLSRLGSFRFVLVTTGLQSHFDNIFEATRGRGILSISVDMACARAGRCVMAVASEPRVQILVNRQASEACAVEFAAAFRLMITEM